MLKYLGHKNILEWIVDQVVSGDFAQAKTSSAALGSRLLQVHHTVTAELLKYLQMETFLSFLFFPFQASIQNR